MELSILLITHVSYIGRQITEPTPQAHHGALKLKNIKKPKQLSAKLVRLSPDKKQLLNACESYRKLEGGYFTELASLLCVIFKQTSILS